MVAVIASGHSPRQQENWSAEEGGRLCDWLLMHSKQGDETRGIPNTTPRSRKKRTSSELRLSPVLLLRGAVACLAF